MQRSLLAGLMAAAVTAVVGTWVVVRGLAFMGDALAHGVIPGVAAASMWGFSPLIGAFAAALVMGGAVGVVSNRTHLREDTGIGLLFVGMLSAGVLIVSRSSSFATDVTGLLFGDVLGVSESDLAAQLVLSVVVVTITSVLYRPLLALTFGHDKAASLGLAPGWTNFVFMSTIALAVVASFQTIGTLLVFGLLIGPPATALLIVRRIPTAMGLAALVGSGCVVVGLVASYELGTSAGATIAGLCVASFFVTLATKELTTRIAGLHRRRSLRRTTAS